MYEKIRRTAVIYLECMAEEHDECFDLQHQVWIRAEALKRTTHTMKYMYVSLPCAVTMCYVLQQMLLLTVLQTILQ